MTTARFAFSGFFAGFALILGASPLRAADMDAYAHRLFDRIAGVPVEETAPIFQRMRALLAAGDRQGAAALVTSDKRFYGVKLRSLIAPLSTKEGDPSAPFDDFQALFLGIVRDDLDLRTFLTGNLRYQAYDGHGLPTPSRADNGHYTGFDAAGLDPWTDLTRVDHQWDDDFGIAAGAFTTRAWGKAFYNAGTNRRAVEYTFQSFLCTPKEKFADAGLPDHFVRRDVDRAKGGEPATYQSLCRNCHAIIDSLGGAFAHMDYVDDKLVYLGADAIADKMNRNNTVYPDGYVTFDDRWQNQAVQHQNAALGWRGTLKGRGLPAYAAMIAGSRGFSECMARRVFTSVCKRDLDLSNGGDHQMLDGVVDRFEAGGYRLRSLVADVASQDLCIELR